MATSLNQPCEVGTINIVLPMKKLRHKEQRSEATCSLQPCPGERTQMWSRRAWLQGLRHHHFSRGGFQQGEWTGETEQVPLRGGQPGGLDCAGPAGIQTVSEPTCIERRASPASPRFDPRTGPWGKAPPSANRSENFRRDPHPCSKSLGLSPGQRAPS